MPRKISFEEFKEKCKQCKDYNNICFDYIDPIKFDYSALQKFYCNIHKIYFFRIPKLIFRKNKKEYFICTDCKLDSIKRKNKINGSKRKGIKSPMSGKEYSYSLEELKQILKSKNDKIELISPIKNKYIRNDKIKLSCSVHGIFEKSIRNIIKSKWICNKCATDFSKISNIKHGEKRRNNFVEEAKQIHGDEYDYSLVDTRGKLDKISIICKIHGIFKQTPSLHLRGEGCPLCSKEGISNNERRLGFCIRNRFPGLKLEQQWNKILKRQKLDYYIDKYKLGIEYHGPQHFINVEWFNDYRHNLQHRQELDRTKYNICKENNIKILYFTFNQEFKDIEYIDKVYTNLGDLYDAIKERAKEFGDILS